MHFPSFPRAKTCRTHLGAALLAALTCLLAAPATWADSGGITHPARSDTYIGASGGSNNTNVVVTSTGYLHAYGGFSDTASTAPGVDNTGKANGNTLTIDSSGEVHNAYGGGAEGNPTEANNNTLIIKGTVINNAYGGYSNAGSATGNKVFVEKGSAVITVYGGSASAGTNQNATDNTVTLAASVGSVRGGYGSGDVVSRNTLNVNAKDLEARGNAENFDTLNFALPADIAAGETMLKVLVMANFPATTTKVGITVTGTPALNVDDEIKLIAAPTLTINSFTPTNISAGGYSFEVRKDGNDLIAKVTKKPPPHNIIDGSDHAQGELICQPKPVTTQGGSTRCEAQPKPGYIFEQMVLVSPAGAATLVSCDANGCDLTDVVGDVTVTGVFKLLPKGNAAAVPTLGGAGLAFTALALPAFAAPVLRRRKKQGKKADTHR